MKILMISDVYFPRVNGVSTSIQTFRKALRARGHEIHLIAPEYAEPADGEEGVLRIPARTVLFDPEDRMMKPSCVRALLPRLRDAQYDLVHIQTPFVAHYQGIRLARLLGIPCIETYHTFFEEYLYHYIPLLPKMALRAVARGFSRSQCNGLDGLVVPSSAMHDVLRSYGVRVPVHVIPTGIPLDQFSGGDGASFRRKLGIDDTAPVMLFVGRAAHEKNIDFLIRAFARALARQPELVLVIAGDGPATTSLKLLAIKLGLERKIHFVGYLDRNRELLDCYRAADAFVFASRTETQGLVLLEAMALGVPVISTAVMGTKDVVGPRRGALVPDDNESDFADAMVHLMGDPELRAKLSRDALAYVREWDAQSLAQRMESLYESLLIRQSKTGQKSMPALDSRVPATRSVNPSPVGDGN